MSSWKRRTLARSRTRPVTAHRPRPLLKTADQAAAAPAGQPSAVRHQYARAHTVRAWAPDYVPGDEGPPLEDLSDSDEEDSPAYLRFDSLYGHGAALSLQHHQPL